MSVFQSVEGYFVDCGYCLSGKETVVFVFTKVTKDGPLLAPLGPVCLPLFLCFALLRGFYSGLSNVNSFVSSESLLGVLCPVALRGWVCLSKRGGR